MKQFITILSCIALAIFGGYISDIKLTDKANAKQLPPITMCYPSLDSVSPKVNLSELGITPQVKHDTIYEQKTYIVTNTKYIKRTLYVPLIFLVNTNTEDTCARQSYNTDTTAVANCCEEK